MSGGRVIRTGRNLTLNGHPYRFTGLNIWRAAVTSINQPLDTGYLVNDGTTLADSLTAISTPTFSCNVFRFWCFQQFALAGGATPSLPYTWTAIDKVLATADNARMKVIACLFDQWNWERANNGNAIASSWYLPGGYDATVEPYDAVPYRQWVSDFITRYAGDDRILMIELVNEPDVQGNDVSPPVNAGSILSAFTAACAGIIKAADPGMLVSVGSAGQVPGQDGADYTAVNGLPVVDMCSMHDYTGMTATGWQGAMWSGGNGLDSCVSRAAALDGGAGKPVYVGEVGLHLTGAPVSGDRAVRAAYLRAKADYAFNTYNVAGYVPWHWDSRNYSDDYNYSLSDPGLAVLRTYLHG